MNIIDVLISKLRKINFKDHFEISTSISKANLKEFVLNTIQNGEYAIILDSNGLYKDYINEIDGLYAEVKKVGIGFIDIRFPSKPEDEEVNIEDYKFIVFGATNDFAKNSIRKQSMILGLSLTDFLLDTSKSININKFLFISNREVLEHWGFKTYISAFRDRKFKCILVE